MFRQLHVEKANEQAKQESSKMRIEDEYVAQLPGWMQQNSISSKVTKLDDELASYFQKAV